MTLEAYVLINLRVSLVVDPSLPTNISALNTLLNSIDLPENFEGKGPISLSQLVTLLTGFSEGTEASVRLEGTHMPARSVKSSQPTTQQLFSEIGVSVLSQSSTSR